MCDACARGLMRLFIPCPATSRRDIFPPCCPSNEDAFHFHAILFFSHDAVTFDISVLLICRCTELPLSLVPPPAHGKRNSGCVSRLSGFYITKAQCTSNAEALCIPSIARKESHLALHAEMFG